MTLLGKIHEDHDCRNLIALVKFIRSFDILILHSPILHIDENGLQEYFPACFLLWDGCRIADEGLRFRLPNWEEAQKSKEQSIKPPIVHKICSIQRKSSQASLQLMLAEFMSHTYLCSFISFQTDFCHSLIVQLILENNVMKKTYFALIFSLIYILALQYKVIQSDEMHSFNYIAWHRWQFQKRLKF